MRASQLLWISLIIPSLMAAGAGPCYAEQEYCGKKDSLQKISYEEARQIAQKSECLQQGALAETHFCNENSGTWWIDLNVPNSNCSPACVIEVETKQASINWRCTGLRK